jgi:coenzyme Q-binding protein COQ10
LPGCAPRARLQTVPLHKETRIVPYTAEQMYSVVADMERYPEFLPWCSALKVLKREPEGGVDIALAEMSVQFQGLKERYVSRVRLDPRAGMIEAKHVEGPFKKLDTRWRFVPLAQGSEVHFLIDFAFGNVLLSAIAGVAFGFVSARMAEAFIHRADDLYRSVSVQT